MPRTARCPMGPLLPHGAQSPRVQGRDSNDPEPAIQPLRRAAAVAAIALAVSMPLGFVLGSNAWTLLAEGLGIPPTRHIPLGVLAVVAAATALIALIVTIVPAHRAAQLHPAAVLRAE